MQHKENIIVWKQWKMAVEWDRNTNGRRIHHKVTESHLHPNIAEKMKNELAETMLNNAGVIQSLCDEYVYHWYFCPILQPFSTVSIL
jgi:hypothetical protein